MGVALRDLDFDQWEWKEELKVLGLEDVSFGEYLKILICINITLKVLIFVIFKVSHYLFRDFSFHC